MLNGDGRFPCSETRLNAKNQVYPFQGGGFSIFTDMDQRGDERSIFLGLTVDVCCFFNNIDHFRPFRLF